MSTIERIVGWSISDFLMDAMALNHAERLVIPAKSIENALKLLESTKPPKAVSHNRYVNAKYYTNILAYRNLCLILTRRVNLNDDC
jgi:hypothetical protein